MALGREKMGERECRAQPDNQIPLLKIGGAETQVQPQRIGRQGIGSTNAHSYRAINMDAGFYTEGKQPHWGKGHAGKELSPCRLLEEGQLGLAGSHMRSDHHSAFSALAVQYPVGPTFTDERL